jgi:hypothetical protein
MTTTTTTTEDRALTLLGQGLGPEIVASAVGVSVSRISQLLSDSDFAARVAELRFTNLAKHNTRDNKYDSLEDKLLEKMENLIEYMHKPFEVLKAISVINAAKRRGSAAPEQLVGQRTVVQLVMPTQVIQQFSSPEQSIQVNINNQVTRAGGQDLVTVQSSQMDRLLSAAKTLKLSSSTQGNVYGPESLPSGASST